MSVSAQQAAQYIASATRVQARALGLVNGDGDVLRYSDLSASDQIALTNAVATYVQAHPELFDTGAADLTNPYLSAHYGTNLGLVDANGYLVGGFIDAALEEERKINPFDSQNIGTVGKWLFAGLLIVGVVYVAATTSDKWLPALKKTAKA